MSTIQKMYRVSAPFNINRALFFAPLMFTGRQNHFYLLTMLTLENRPLAMYCYCYVSCEDN